MNVPCIVICSGKARVRPCRPEPIKTRPLQRGRYSRALDPGVRAGRYSADVTARALQLLTKQAWISRRLSVCVQTKCREGKGTKLSRSSREAAKECSPQRKLWVAS